LKNKNYWSIRVLCIVFSLFVSSTLLANNFASPTNVRIEGDKLLWDPVEGAGGYNIYWNLGYLTTVKNRTDFKMQVDGRYQVVAFDQSATRFSSQFADNVSVNYAAGSVPTESNSSGGLGMKVVSVTCRNVGPGETCSASCLVPNSFHAATGGACATSDIVEADASASAFSYSCTVPTFSGEVTAQVYCIDRRAFR